MTFEEYRKMSKADEFDKWFKSTYPEYCCGEAVIEPYYSIASYAWECAEQKQEKVADKLYNRVISCAEHQIADLKANFDLAIEGSDLKIKELEQQIEKMKCCGNCAKRGHICVAEEMQGNLCGKNKDKWELRR